MKAVFYVGAALMIGAGIYGFVDYKKVSRSESFNKMYEEKRQTRMVTPAAETNPVSQEELDAKKGKARSDVKGKATSSIKLRKAGKAMATKKIHYKEFSRAPLREEPEIIQPVKSKN